MLDGLGSGGRSRGARGAGVSRRKKLRGRQDSMCKTCPFHEAGPGRDLRDSLTPGRFDGILADLRAEKVFPCHDDYSLVCAGSIAWQLKNHCVPTDLQIAERLLAHAEGRKARY